VSGKDRQAKSKTYKSGSTESPWPKRTVQIIGAAVVIGLVAVVFLSQPELRGVPDGTVSVAVGDPEHVDGDLHADSEVPAGGEHDPVWQNCGYYSAEIRSENAVHSLEHGAVWISYDPTLAPDDIDSLRGFVSRNEKVLVSPVPGQDSLVIVTAWTRQLRLDDVSDTRLGQFVNEFSGSPDAPEPGASCRGGVGDPSF
jgi:hypothetical protein